MSFYENIFAYHLSHEVWVLKNPEDIEARVGS